jgi:2-C-methyl-D-erythritol 2,4-cyclodiphosphate synthase
MPTIKKIRTGFGFDSHLFSSRGVLALGGVPFRGTPALTGHSDGDALLHAVIDALLGAACLGDIGDMFPDTSKKLKGVSSRKLLQLALRRVRDAGFSPEHVDVTVLADTPRLGAAKMKMKRALANDLKLPPSAVNVKAKTQEGLALFRAPGGIAVWAVATIASS